MRFSTRLKGKRKGNKIEQHSTETDSTAGSATEFPVDTKQSFNSKFVHFFPPYAFLIF